MASRTSNYYKQNPEARKRRLKQQAEYNKTAEGMKIRTDANKLNRRLGTYGNGDGKDMSHTKSNTLVKEKQSSNRARNGKGNNKRKK